MPFLIDAGQAARSICDGLERDTLTFRPVASGTEVTYAAEFTFRGLSRIVAPLLKPAFERLGNEAEAGMRMALNRL